MLGLFLKKSTFFPGGDGLDKGQDGEDHQQGQIPTHDDVGCLLVWCWSGDGGKEKKRTKSGNKKGVSRMRGVNGGGPL